MPEPYRVQVQSGIPPSALAGLTNFIETHYLTPNMMNLKGGGFSTGRDASHFYLAWTLDPVKGAWLALPPGFPEVSVNLSISSESVTAEFSGVLSSDPRAISVCDRIADDIEAMVTSFLNAAKKTSLHFVFSVGHIQSDVPRQSGGFGREVLKRIFAGNAMNFYLLIMALSFIFILVLGGNAIIAIIAVQVVALVFSDRLMLSAGTVRVTQDHPEVAVVRISCSPEVFQSLTARGKKVVGSIRDATDRAISEGNLGAPETKSAIYGILQQAGINCSLEDIEVKRSNPYEIVKGVSEKFSLPMPKITLVNSPMDNAAATGISPGNATITITAGALEDLKDGELRSVIGHELGHIKGRDPIILFIVTTVMYLGGLYLWLPIILALGIFYFFVAFGFIYLVGKFLETRADTESVVVLGTPRLLASALTRIGFAQLYFERYSSSTRFFDWLRFDPHPPIYFRVKRLSLMPETGAEIRHTLLVSVRDCLRGFFGALVDAG